jgi:8-oxo-dGTP diphosphatase
MSPVIRTAALVLIRDARLLLVKPDYLDVFFLPGGKLEHGEGPLDALEREVGEELAVRLRPATVEYACTIDAAAFIHADDTRVSMACFRGEVRGCPRPSGETRDLGWFTPASYARERHRAPAVTALFAYLESTSQLNSGEECG